MVDFSDAHKAERSTNYFGEGIHKVLIESFVFDTTPKNQEYVEITVVDPENDERTASTRFWFTTDGAINYAFNILRGIFVHNAPDDKKDATRDKFNKISNTTELEKQMDMLIGKECWLQVYQQGTYAGKDGTPRPNYNRDIYGYEPAAKDTQADIDAAKGPITVTDENGHEQTVAEF
jgi:hypothetical protein